MMMRAEGVVLRSNCVTALSSLQLPWFNTTFITGSREFSY